MNAYDELEITWMGVEMLHFDEQFHHFSRGTEKKYENCQNNRSEPRFKPGTS